MLILRTNDKKQITYFVNKNVIPDYFKTDENFYNIFF